MEMLFMGDIKKTGENLFLRRMNSHLEECFMYSDMLFNYLSAYCQMEPAISTYIAIRLLLTHFHWGLVFYSDMPQTYQSFYETCWDSFWDLVASEGGRTEPLRYLSFLLTLTDTNGELHQGEQRMIRTWYHEIEKKLHEEQLFCAKPCKKSFLQIAIPELEECTGSATVREEDVPVLLQYYNPIIAPHSETGIEASFEYLFNDSGDFDFEKASVPLPGISLDDTIALIKAEILNENRTGTDPISVSLMNRTRIEL